jgi:hypothetical protein
MDRACSRRSDCSCSPGGNAVQRDRLLEPAGEQRKRRTGSATASAMGWRNRPLRLAGERAWLLERLAAQPDLMLRGVQASLRRAAFE